jgi:hypothetical protein
MSFPDRPDSDRTTLIPMRMSPPWPAEQPADRLETSTKKGCGTQPEREHEPDLENLSCQRPPTFMAFLVLFLLSSERSGFDPVCESILDKPG